MLQRTTIDTKVSYEAARSQDGKFLLVGSTERDGVQTSVTMVLDPDNATQVARWIIAELENDDASASDT